MNKRDLVSKVDQALTEAHSLTELERFNPRTVREYCYRDGCPTDWTRKDIDGKDVRVMLIPYYCDSCADRGYFRLRTEGEKK